MIKEMIKVEDNEYSEGESSEPLSQTLRVDTELFKDEDYVAHNVVGVRLIDLPNGCNDWEITDKNHLVLTLKGIRFTNKEKEFLQSTDGILFIINGYKKGWKSISQFKREIKGNL